MRKISGLLFILAVSLPSTVRAQRSSSVIDVAPSSRPAATKKVALVIGNGAYDQTPLKNPTNDAEDVAEKLRGLGFDVTLEKNIRLKNKMIRVIEEFGDKIPNDGVALFYYAGHGAQADGNNYLIPTSAKIFSEENLKDQGVGMEVVMGAMSSPDRHLNIIIIDACRNNLHKTVRTIPEGLAAVVGPRGTYIAYATAPGSMAYESTGRNGLFTKHLLNHIGEPAMKIEDMFKLVRADVTGDKENDVGQMPWDASSLLSEFYFKPKGASLVIVANRPGLEIYLNDKLLGEAAERGQRFRVSDIEPGRALNVTGRTKGGADEAGAVRGLVLREGQEAVVEIGEVASPNRPTIPSIKIREIPLASIGGDDKWVDIAGEVAAVPAKDYRVVIYSWTDKWWVQPEVGKGLTMIGADGRWRARIHGGAEYAVLLVKPTFKPQNIMYDLPEVGGDVVAVMTVPGGKDNNAF